MTDTTPNLIVNKLKEVMFCTLFLLLKRQYCQKLMEPQNTKMESRNLVLSCPSWLQKYNLNIQAT